MYSVKKLHHSDTTPDAELPPDRSRGAAVN
jgi:hypothetical protein